MYLAIISHSAVAIIDLKRRLKETKDNKGKIDRYLISKLVDKKNTSRCE